MHTLEELEEEIRAKKEVDEKAQIEYVKSKAETETKEISLIAQDANKTIATKINSKVVNYIDSSPDAEKKINETAEKVVDKGLETHLNKVETELNKSKTDRNKSEFDLDADAYKAFGQETSPNATWKKRMIQYGNNFWFIVLFIVCFFTLAPFYNFMRVIQTQSGILKWVAIITGVVMLLAIFGGLTFACLKWSGVV